MLLLTLSDLCIRSICDSIEDGLITSIHLAQIPPNGSTRSLRQKILDVILLRSSIDNPNCLRALGSRQFLQGMSSLSTLLGDSDDSRFLRSIIHDSSDNNEADRGSTSFEIDQTLHRSIDFVIKDLQLNIFARPYWGVPVEKPIVGREANLQPALGLISECLQLRSLTLRMRFLNAGCRGWYPSVNIFDMHTPGGFLNRLPEFEISRQIFENLDSLTISGTDRTTKILGSKVPIFEFKNLSRLKLQRLMVYTEAWKNLMGIVGDSLEQLEIGDHFRTLTGDGDLLPIVLPNLRHLIIDELFDPSLHTFRLDFKILKKFPRLDYLKLRLSQDFDDENLEILESLDPGLKILITLDLKESIDEIPGAPPFLIDNPPRFRLCHVFNSKIQRLSLAPKRWTPDYSAAFEHFTKACSNLEKFEIRVTQEIQISPDLSPLFGDLENRVPNLRSVTLKGSIPIADRFFEHGRHLRKFKLKANEDLTDAHLIRYAENGCRVEKLLIDRCPKISDRGLIAMIKSSGSMLKKIKYRGPGINDEERFEKVVKNNCPYAVMELR